MYKGFNKNCSVSSSIPTKNQSVVIRNVEKKGFSSQTKRFPSQSRMSEHVGPGSYGCISTADVISPSFSKKGTSGFVACKAARASNNHQRGIPGPNVYNLQGSFINKYDFNIGVSRVFRLPVAAQLDGPKHKTPAPNQYDVRCVHRERNVSMAGTSPFLSKTGRNSFCLTKDVPSPCHYDVNSNLFQHGPEVLSPFKSKTLRIPPPLDHHVPGPGAYHPHQVPAPVKKTILPRRHYLAISAPPLTVSKDPPLPGPGHYDLIFAGLSKHPMPTAAFASKTERITQTSQTEGTPGPGYYDPHVLSKQSFFYCDSSVWLPV